MLKKMLVLTLVISLGVLYGCTEKSTTTLPEDETALPLDIKSISGFDDVVEVSKNDYFHPLKDIEIINEQDENIAYLFNVKGQVNYGVVGDYTLNYSLSYGDEVITKTRTIKVLDQPIIEETTRRNQSNALVVPLDGGSYRSGAATDINHPVNPLFINPSLLDKAVPSNGWWTSLLVNNYGGGNGIYTNPLRSAFSNLGAEITNPGAGFVQYWNPENYNTMANFSLALPDMYLKTSSLNEGYQTYVEDYSDSTVSVAMKNVGGKEDHMVLTYQQGSPYVYAEVMDQTKPFISIAGQGSTGIEFYSVDGNKLTSTSYMGSGIVIRYVSKHIGYETSRPAQVGQPIYGDRYFLVSTPDGSTFNLTSSKVSLNLNGSNMFSVSAIQDLDEASFYHDRAYLKPLAGDVSFTVDHTTSMVETTYTTSIQDVLSTNRDPLLFLLPHHYQNSEQTLLNYEFETIRGHLKLMQGNQFKTTLSFNGLLPAMTLPKNSEFSTSDMTDYLSDLSEETLVTDTENFLNDEGPYWNSKAIYPLAQGIIIADQMGNDSLKVDLISKLKYVLTDWFTYSASGDDRYLYYNEAWGSVYYSNNDFNTASELSDHAFTHGYLVYASSVLAMYDASFYSDYGKMVDILLNDFMYPVKDDYNYRYLRSFDPWAGHTWAHGFGSFAEGNNIESSSEAIQSWVGGYLWALKKGDTKLRDTAIYGFAHELSSAKTYMFDYEGIVFKDNYSEYASVAGMIWGGKYDYATWFGANPTFIYGIQWLPNGEYISNYALNDTERAKLTLIYQDYLDAKNGTIDTWFANMWSIQALIDPSIALAQFDPSKILADDYPADLSQTYYLLNGLKTYGQRSTAFVMKLHPNVTSSIYTNGDGTYALIWNPSDTAQKVLFYGPNEEVVTKDVEANSFKAYKLV